MDVSSRETKEVQWLHLIWPIDQHTKGAYINNTVIQNNPCCTNPNDHLGYGIEVSGYDVLVQGNVVGVNSQSVNAGYGWEHRLALTDFTMD